MSDIVYIDDEITETTHYGRQIKKIIAPTGYSLEFLNNKKKVDSLLENAATDIKLVLLDLDLSKMSCEALDILKILTKKRLKVIMLSGLSKVSKLREEAYRNLPSMNTLYSDGASAYIYKSELDESQEFVRNIIRQTIDDPTNLKISVTIDDEVAKLIFRDDAGQMKSFEKDLSDVSNKWKEKSMTDNSWEIILRMLYEMGKAGKTEVRLSNIYGDKKLGDILPPDFQKKLGMINDDIREKSEGCIVGRFLYSPGGRGDRSGIYKVNIGSVKLKSPTGESFDVSWKESVERRLALLEAQLNNVKLSS